MEMKQTKKISKGEKHFLSMLSEIWRECDKKNPLFVSLRIVDGKPELFDVFDDEGKVYFSDKKIEKIDYIG
jgi:hypothetical protein